MADQETRAELNRLYWESDASVADIADRLDISRRALYDGIEPRPTGAPCPDCGAPLGFRNRTSAENQEAECAACGREVKLGADRTDPEPEVEQEREAARLSPARARRTSGDGPALAIAFLFGIGLGATIAGLFRRG